MKKKDFLTQTYIINFSLCLSVVLGLNLNASAFELAQQAKDYFKTSVYEIEQKKLILSPLIGYGQKINQLSINDTYELTTTNRNFLLLGANINNKTSLSGSFYFKDPDSSLKSRVNSKVENYELTTSWSRYFKSILYYSSNQGYYQEENVKSSLSLMSFTNLGVSQYGVNLYYLQNPDYQFTQTDPFVSTRQESAGSIIYSLNFARSRLTGLQSLKTINSNIADTESAYVTLISPRIGYGYNWLLNSVSYPGVFFANISVSLGMNIYMLTEKTVDGNSVKKQDSKINTMLSSSVGYVADSHTLGVFQHYTEYKYKLSKTDVGFKTGTIGLYYIHKF